MHERVRARILGLCAGRDARPTSELITEQYRGIRPAPGYPAQPDHTEKATLFRSARRRAPHRREADGELRDVAGLFGQRALSLASRGALFRRRQDRARSGRGLRRTQGHGPSHEVERWLAPILNYDRRPFRSQSAGAETSQVVMHEIGIAREAAASDQFTREARSRLPLYSALPFLPEHCYEMRSK